ncbi:hypothetical protein TCA2_4469 [Paenibacillus sp. TCA20]|uniref:hypothetical protein n=1 Tax=Paenibacillus sp. TCA20 TaxID=1499968 RepID=UPI0004D6421A|nr:hypothetical protein [Paenibacillus sp. TCA20]GAK41977.1 hypothetical protein TCA2_4469 [Paenibacillus sp. TCA20]
MLPQDKNRPGWARINARVEFIYFGKLYLGVVEDTSYTFCTFKNVIDLKTNKPANIPFTIAFAYIQNPIVRAVV